MLIKSTIRLLPPGAAVVSLQPPADSATVEAAAMASEADRINRERAMRRPMEKLLSIEFEISDMRFEILELPREAP